MSNTSFLAEVSCRSPQKSFIFIVYKIIFWIKVYKKKIFNFEKGSTGYIMLKEYSLVVALKGTQAMA